MDSFPNGDGLDADTFFIRSTYMLMLVGCYPSPLGPRREVKAADLESLGEWKSCATSEPPMGFHLLEGAYEYFEDSWPNAVLPAWYHSDHKEWECDEGYFTEARRWMVIPWLPNVWQAAIEKLAADDVRMAALIEASRRQ